TGNPERGGFAPHGSGSLPDTRYHLTVFASEFANNPERFVSLSVFGLAQAITSQLQGCKADLPWLKLAGFGENVTDKGSYRSNANMLWISGVEGDYDGGVLTIDV